MKTLLIFLLSLGWFLNSGREFNRDHYEIAATFLLISILFFSWGTIRIFKVEL